MDPSRNIVLEASAGTGKTRVLVERYVNLLLSGVDPHNILAITFTRKAAAEMRRRVIERLKEERWRDLSDRRDDIEISTIDAFCLSLLREFPLEADVDPGFDLADETEVPRLIDEALDGALRIGRARATRDEEVALVFAELGERRLRAGLASLIDRRGVVPDLLGRYLAKGPKDLTASRACEEATRRLRQVFDAVPDGLDRFLDEGPMRRPAFAMLAADLRALCRPDLPGPATETRPAAFDDRAAQAAFRVLIDRLRAYFLTQEGRPRRPGFAGTGFAAADCASAESWKRHRARAADLAAGVADVVRAFDRDLNVVMARGVWRLYGVALDVYRRSLEAHGLLDFSGVVERALDLLSQMDEFAKSRYRLEARYHHVLVDEFQDTSRAQWALVAQLVRSWSEGLGAAGGALPPSIFIVGDRKQSIYGFRDADLAVLEDAAAFIDALRPEGRTRRAIATSFRAQPALLAFVNDVFAAIDREEGSTTIGRKDRFRYGESDRFPLGAERAVDSQQATSPLGLVVGDTVQATAEGVADEVVRLLTSATVRDRQSGARRQVERADIAILFRSRESHREFEAALERRGVPTYVYKGLGFFEADEIQDVMALLRYLADPASDLRAAALLRSRLVRLSDPGVMCLAPSLAAAITGEDAPGSLACLSSEDQTVLARLRASVARWLAWVDRMTPAALLDEILRETAYHFELRGSRWLQARENLKKLRGLVRRVQNHGYATLARMAEHLDHLALGDESNAAIDAVDAVSLMTVHAAKGLEFPVVFVVNIGRGTGSARRSIRVALDAADEPSVAIAGYQSEADEDQRVRDREETKRLLYVALTRARDRLYLSATVQRGVWKTGVGSLGDVLPRSLVAAIAQAGAGDGERIVNWTPSEGRSHELSVIGSRLTTQGLSGHEP